MIKNLLFTVAMVFAVFIQSPTAFALVAGPAKIVGAIKSFDTKVVIVENEDHRYEVPKDFVAEKNLKVGNEIEITLSQEQTDKVKIEKKKPSKQ